MIQFIGKMDKHVKDYFSEFSGGSMKGNFHKVIALHQARDVTWETLTEQAPELSRGWFELSRLDFKDRIEFTLEYWLTKIPYNPHLLDFLERFFDSLDDIGVFLTQKMEGEPFEANMVYSLAGDVGFYRGASPANDDDIVSLQKHFLDCILPEDYIAFLEIHNGFWKTTDTTGLLGTKTMWECYNNFQNLLKSLGSLKTREGEMVNPKRLIPFYESFGMPYFQCFWSDWYPENEMGNVYYSGETNTISEVEDEKITTESMAFPTFTDWLMFYLEQCI